MLVVARVYEEQLGDADQALETNRQILELDENNAQAIAALERLYLKTERYPELLGIYEKKLELGAGPGAAEGDPLQDRPPLRERDQGLRRRPSRAYQAILDGMDGETSCRPGGRSIASTPRRAQWKELQATIPRELDAGRSGRHARPSSTSSSASGRSASSTCRRAGRDRLLPRDPRARCRRTPAARAGAGAAPRRRRSTSSRSAGILAADLRAARRVAAPHRGPRDPAGAHRRRRRARTASPCCSRIGELWAQQVGDGEKALRRLQPLLPRGSVQRAVPRRAGAAGGAAGRLGAAGGAVRGGDRQGRASTRC